MTTHLRLTACRYCRCPITTEDSVIHIACDLTNLTPTSEAHAWLASSRTYLVRSLRRQQWLLWRPHSIHLADELIAHITTGTIPTRTVLATHHCPGPALPDLHLSTWAPHDRAATLPPPRPRKPTPQEAPF
jgi:hypothetical protein